MKIGLPRTFIYYVDHLDWERFFAILGHEVVVPSLPGDELLNLGQPHCNTDACLAVKHYHGHVVDLLPKVDALFVPQLVSLKKGSNCCPKVIAIPMLVRNAFPQGTVLSPGIDANHPLWTNWEVLKLAKRLSNDPRKILRALEHFRNRFSFPPPEDGSGHSTGKAIGLLGHPYSVSDPALNLDLIDRIRRYGYQVVTPNTWIDRQAWQTKPGKAFGCKDVHWDCGQRLVDTAGYYLENPEIEGIITVTFFGCGIDAFVEEIYRSRLSQEKPYLTLTFDEHTGEAGLITRLEAFLDMMSRRKN